MSHAIKTASTDQIAFFRAYNDDGSPKTDLTSATAGLSISVFRIGATAISIPSPTDKAADDTTHSDGAIRQVSGNLYTIDLPDAAIATQVPSISIKGSYTGGVIDSNPHPIVGYDGTVTAVGANTTVPPTLAQFANTDTGEATAVDGSVAKLAQGVAGVGSPVFIATANAVYEPELTGPIIKVYYRSPVVYNVTVTSSADITSLVGVDVELIVEENKDSTTDLLVVESSEISFTIDPNDNSRGVYQVVFTESDLSFSKEGDYIYCIRRVSNKEVLIRRSFIVKYAPYKDSP